ncbi:hypothetical protein RchiOBHm_Chr7g0181381 [Rosa chinensis]|uniref:Uncharacterized protein n=1 Tax=Rosa chinensis TaxID=74649 RepID=A0A2P6P2L0_ROSCH|nr:hypothetical protein RchiOBHm_Chr7g0181381 [Rosa chinensis]
MTDCIFCTYMHGLAWPGIQVQNCLKCVLYLNLDARGNAKHACVGTASKLISFKQSSLHHQYGIKGQEPNTYEWGGCLLPMAY